MAKGIVYCCLLVFCTLVLSYPAQGQDVTQFRGVMVNSAAIAEADVRFLKESWNVNMVRWPLSWQDWNSPANTASPEEYDAWLETALKGLDRALPLFEKYGIKVLVDLHTAPGGRSQSRESRMFEDPRFQAQFIQVWNRIAARYASSPVVWGYDIANEPIQGTVASGLLNWQALATRVSQNIRAIDTRHTLVVAASNYNSFKELLPLSQPVDNVVYTFHMYQPWDFTGQGIPPNRDVFKYPGVIRGKMWDKAQLRRVLQPVVDFQRRYGARVMVGEFSAVRWAPGGSSYVWLKDSIDIFEQNGWDWVYHAFREYNGWSVEHTESKNDQNPASRMTNREKLLRSWLQKNR